MPEENIPILGTSGAGTESSMCQNESLKVMVGRAIPISISLFSDPTHIIIIVCICVCVHYIPKDSRSSLWLISTNCSSTYLQKCFYHAGNFLSSMHTIKQGIQ